MSDPKETFIPPPPPSSTPTLTNITSVPTPPPMRNTPGGYSDVDPLWRSSYSKEEKLVWQHELLVALNNAASFSKASGSLYRDRLIKLRELIAVELKCM